MHQVAGRASVGSESVGREGEERVLVVRSPRFPRFLSSVAIFVFVMVSGTSGLEAVSDDLSSSPRALSKAFRDASSKAIPSVVTIIVFGQAEEGEEEGMDEEFENVPLESGPSFLPPTGLGSGVAIGKDVVLTNNHVVRDAKRVIVRLQDGTELNVGKVIGDVTSDIATLRLAEDAQLSTASLGNSEAVEIGDWVLAIGSPFQLEATVSAGIISAKDRALPNIPRASLLQTDAVINPGNSGGPLINIDGEVIGINTAIATRNGVFQGIGFAVPIDQARWIAEELLEHGKVRRSKIGVQLAELKRAFADQLGMEMNSGVVAYQVTKGSPAEKGGMHSMDVITEFGGRRVRRPAELRQVIERRAAGTAQKVKVVRHGEEMELEVTLEAADE